MAWVKNITCEPEKKMLSALFHDVVGTNRKKIVMCDDCRHMLHRSNSARHHKHCGQSLRRDTTRGIKMKFKLTGVTKALEDKVHREKECQSLDLRHLPRTPETDEEITRSLAKLYAEKVRKPRTSRLSLWWNPLGSSPCLRLDKQEGLGKHWEPGDGGCIRWKSGLGRLEKQKWGRRAATLRADPEDVQPLVLGEVPKEGVASSASPRCPPSNPASPTEPGKGSADLPPTATNSFYHVKVKGFFIPVLVINLRTD